MNHKLLLFVYLFLTSALHAQESENRSTIDSEKLRTKVVEILKEEKENRSVIADWAVKSGILGKALKDRINFRKNFSNLSTEKQKQQIEQWLESNSCEKCKEHGEALVKISERKNIDEETIECIIKMQEEIAEQADFKDELFCIALLDDTMQQCDDDKKFAHEFEVKMYFHKLRKKESLESEQRKKELQELEQQALESFDSLRDFLHHDTWHGGRRAH